MTSFVRKVLVYSNHQEFVMKQMLRKDVVGIVTFDLIGLPPTSLIIYTFISLAWVSNETHNLQHVFCPGGSFFYRLYRYMPR